MAANLAPVFLDDTRVQLQGDPKPEVSKIIVAGGKQPNNVQVVRLKSQADTEGRPLRLEDVIDRTAQSATPVYLRVKELPKSGSPTPNPGNREQPRKPTGDKPGTPQNNPSTPSSMPPSPQGERFKPERPGSEMEQPSGQRNE